MDAFPLKIRTRFAFLATLVGVLSCLGVYQLWAYFDAHAPTLALALAGGLMAAAATAAGTLPILTMRTLSARVQDSMYGFGAGIMLAATAFSLTIPGLEAAAQEGHGPWAAGAIMAVAITPKSAGVSRRARMTKMMGCAVLETTSIRADHFSEPTALALKF